MMATATALESNAPNNRREFFRINDHVGLRIAVLTENEFHRFPATAASHHERQHLLNSMIVSSESRRAALRGIREESTAIANFLTAMDEKIDILANLMAQEYSQAPEEQTHEVNLSASGIRFFSDEIYSPGTHLELHVHLFPSDHCLRLYGTVAWCQQETNPRSPRESIAVAVDYSEISDSDREILFRHINSLQLDSVRREMRS